VFSILDHLALPHPSKADRLMLRTSLAGSGGVRDESGTPQTCSKYGASAPFVSGDGGFQERRWSNSKAASGWPWKFPPSIGSSPSSRAGGLRAGSIGGRCLGDERDDARNRCAPVGPLPLCVDSIGMTKRQAAMYILHSARNSRTSPELAAALFCAHRQR
jgi:hypothetical protein